MLDRGRIVEEGSRAELLCRDGRYAALWRRQSGGFIDSSASQQAARAGSRPLCLHLFSLRKARTIMPRIFFPTRLMKAPHMVLEIAQIDVKPGMEASSKPA